MTLLALGKAAVTPIPTFPSTHYSNLTTQMFNGSSNVSVGVPQVGNLIKEVLFTYNDAFAFSYFIIFAMPFVMIWIANGSIIRAGILGMIVYTFVSLFIPTNAQVFAVIGMFLSLGITIYGVWKS